MNDVMEVSGPAPTSDAIREGPSTPKRLSRLGILGRLISVGSFACVTALCAWIGYFATFNSFGGWDDEGYLLFSLRTFARHGGLYTHIYSAFGPLYYEAFGAFFHWLPVTLDNGRIATIAVTLLTGLCFGLALRTFTGSLIVGLATQIGTFSLLIVSYADESMHPIVLEWLLFALALVSLAQIARGKRGVGFLALGATVAALELTIINAGTYAIVALAFTGVALAPRVTKMIFPRTAAVSLFVAAPILVVMVGSHATESWALKYALIVTLAATAVVVVTRDRKLQGLLHRIDVYRFLVGGGAMSTFVVIPALITGTAPADLVRGVFIDTVKSANYFTGPFFVPTWVDVWGAVCVAGVVLYRHFLNKNPWVEVGDACFRIAVGLFLIYVAVATVQILGTVNLHLPITAITFVAALPLLCVSSIPSAGSTGPERMSRVALVTLAVTEGLIAYPVAGAQVIWSSLLMLPVGMLSLYDGARQLRSSLIWGRSHRHGIGLRLLAPMVFLAVFIWLASVLANDLSSERTRYMAGTSLALPGSHLIRLPAAYVKSVESLSQAIRRDCSSFVTIPAINSFYLWTGESPPTDWFNVWFYTENTALQRQIVRHVEQTRPRFCVVENPQLSKFWYQGYPLPQLPLVRLVERFRQENGPPQLFGYDYQLFVSHGAAR